MRVFSPRIWLCPPYRAHLGTKPLGSRPKWNFWNLSTFGIPSGSVVPSREIGICHKFLGLRKCRAFRSTHSQHSSAHTRHLKSATGVGLIPLTVITASSEWRDFTASVIVFRNDVRSHPDILVWTCHIRVWLPPPSFRLPRMSLKLLLLSFLYLFYCSDGITPEGNGSRSAPS
ncbi:hypothetical protein L218DRAFT_249559 [Marasmius fiardii PR-910]|nr:hypothetical protein L218DRAFT_249559 [Marasmius fiardii PR-910]